LRNTVPKPIRLHWETVIPDHTQLDQALAPQFQSILDPCILTPPKKPLTLSLYNKLSHLWSFESEIYLSLLLYYAYMNHQVSNRPLLKLKLNYKILNSISNFILKSACRNIFMTNWQLQENQRVNVFSSKNPPPWILPSVLLANWLSSPKS